MLNPLPIVYALEMKKTSRALYGARGLKYPVLNIAELERRSRPVWGAWIEIPKARTPRSTPASRAPYGARGLKLN